jgi:L-fucose isomerase
MLFGHLLTGGTAQLFADVRTYWSPDAVRRVTGHRLSGIADDGILHLINSGPAALDWTGRQSRDGKPAVKPFGEITADEAQACLRATKWCPSMTEYFPGGGWSTDFTTRGGMPCTMFRLNLVKGSARCCRSPRGRPWTCPRTSTMRSMRAPTRPGRPPGSCPT